MADQSNSETSNLRPASENPYYVLATVYGEHKSDGIRLGLHKKNRQAWNAWSLQNFTPDQKAEWSKEHNFDLSGLPDWSDIEADVTARFANRLPGAMVPSPGDDLSFENNIFEHPVCFDGFWFTGDARFRGATFTGAAMFSNVTFTGAALFRDATFTGVAEFYDATFTGAAEFYDVTFTGDALFGGATFTGVAEFYDATFTGVAWFVGVTFTGAAMLRDATFTDDAIFALSTFTRDANFQGVVFEHYSYFDRVRFGGACYLSSTRFEKPCDFSNATFETQFPRLNAALLHERTILTASAENWPFRLNGQDPEDARASCAMLRHTVAKQGLPEDEHFFFRHEMACAVRMAKVKALSPYFWFGALSEYGYSISRPFLCLIWLWTLGAVVIWHFDPGPVTIWEYSAGDWKAFAQSASNIFPYFGFRKAYLGDYMKDAPGWLVGFSMLQTVFGALLLFLLGLGLRTRFRLR